MPHPSSTIWWLVGRLIQSEGYPEVNALDKCRKIKDFVLFT